MPNRINVLIRLGVPFTYWRLPHLSRNQTRVECDDHWVKITNQGESVFRRVGYPIEFDGDYFIVLSKTLFSECLIKIMTLCAKSLARFITCCAFSIAVFSAIFFFSRARTMHKDAQNMIRSEAEVVSLIPENPSQQGELQASASNENNQAQVIHSQEKSKKKSVAVKEKPREASVDPMRCSRIAQINKARLWGRYALKEESEKGWYVCR